MLLTTIDRVLINPWSEETHAWVSEAAHELATVFRAVGWQWSGQDVDSFQLSEKVIDLTFCVAREMQNSPDRSVCAISSGRVKVEARRGEVGTGNIALTIMLECLIGQGMFVAA